MVQRLERGRRQPGAERLALPRSDRPRPGRGLSSTAAWTAQASEPAYFWNNAGFGLNPNHNNTGAWIVAGRDYFTGSTPAPGYTAYPYPHPLTREPPLPQPARR